MYHKKLYEHVEIFRKIFVIGYRLAGRKTELGSLSDVA